MTRSSFLCLALLVPALILSVKPSLAQRARRDPQGRAARAQVVLKERLQLTEQQSQQVAKIFNSKIGICRRQPEGEAKRQCRQELRRQVDREILEILSPEQKQKYSVLKDELSEQRRNSRAGFM